MTLQESAPHVQSAKHAPMAVRRLGARFVLPAPMARCDGSATGAAVVNTEAFDACARLAILALTDSEKLAASYALAAIMTA